LVGPTGRVLAIEMMPATADILRQHVATNDCTNVELVEKALSDRAGDTIMAKVPAGKHGHRRRFRSRLRLVRGT
jgi:FkbM family methyltransferase